MNVDIPRQQCRRICILRDAAYLQQHRQQRDRQRGDVRRDRIDSPQKRGVQQESETPAQGSQRHRGKHALTAGLADCRQNQEYETPCKPELAEGCPRTSIMPVSAMYCRRVFLQGSAALVLQMKPCGTRVSLHVVPWWAHLGNDGSDSSQQRSWPPQPNQRSCPTLAIRLAEVKLLEVGRLGPRAHCRSRPVDPGDSIASGVRAAAVSRSSSGLRAASRPSLLGGSSNESSMSVATTREGSTSEEFSPSSAVMIETRL